jgi:hypothetical protein
MAAPARTADHNRVLLRQGCAVMATAEEYDRYASECLRIAASASDERQRLLMLEMAQAWVRLAALAAKHSREGRTTTG